MVVTMCHYSQLPLFEEFMTSMLNGVEDVVPIFVYRHDCAPGAIGTPHRHLCQDVRTGLIGFFGGAERASRSVRTLLVNHSPTYSWYRRPFLTVT